MTTKELCARINMLNFRIDAKLRHIETLRDLLTVGSPPMDADHVSRTRDVSSMADRVAKVVDAEKEVDEMVDELDGLKKLLIATIGQLEDPVEMLFITERYLEGKGTDVIANEHRYTRRRIQQIIRAGREKLDAMLPD